MALSQRHGHRRTAAAGSGSRATATIRCSTSATRSSGRRRAVADCAIDRQRGDHQRRREPRERHELRLHRRLRPAVGGRSGAAAARRLRRADADPRPACRGRRRSTPGGSATCSREANGKDQRGLARFYDGNGDRDFACDSGAVEFQGLLDSTRLRGPARRGDRLVPGRLGRRRRPGPDRGAVGAVRPDADRQRRGREPDPDPSGSRAAPASATR